MVGPKLIVIEGSDASGKKTQTKLLVDLLHQRRIETLQMSFPVYDSPTGKVVSQYLAGEFGPTNSIDPKIASTWYALDRYAHMPRMKRSMGSGATVVCDRYVESNMGHQGGKIESCEERAKFFKWCDQLEYDTLELIRPSVCFFLHVPWEMSHKLIAMRALAEGRELDGHEADKTHLKMAESSYLQLAGIYNWITIECCDGAEMRAVDDISREIRERLDEWLITFL